MKPDRKIDRSRMYEIAIEPDFSWKDFNTRIADTEDKFRLITIRVYAHNIEEAKEKAKNILNLEEKEIEVTGVIAQGGWYNRTIQN